MTVQILMLRGEKFVLLKEKDYRALKMRPAPRARKSRKARRLTAQDRADVAEALRRLSDPKDVARPWDEVRKEMGLA